MAGTIELTSITRQANDSWMARFRFRGLGHEIRSIQMVKGRRTEEEATEAAWKFLGDAIYRGLDEEGVLANIHSR